MKFKVTEKENSCIYEVMDYINLLEDLLQEHAIKCEPADDQAKSFMKRLNYIQLKSIENKLFLDKIRFRTFFVPNSKTSIYDEIDNTYEIITGTATILCATMYDENTKVFKTAFLYCSPADEFDERYGKGVVIGRLKVTPKISSKGKKTRDYWREFSVTEKSEILPNIKRCCVEIAHNKEGIIWMQKLKETDLMSRSEYVKYLEENCN